MHNVRKLVLVLVAVAVSSGLCAVRRGSTEELLLEARRFIEKVGGGFDVASPRTRRAARREGHAPAQYAEHVGVRIACARRAERAEHRARFRGAVPVVNARQAGQLNPVGQQPTAVAVNNPVQYQQNQIAVNQVPASQPPLAAAQAPRAEEQADGARLGVLVGQGQEAALLADALAGAQGAAQAAQHAGVANNVIRNAMRLAIALAAEPAAPRQQGEAHSPIYQHEHMADESGAAASGIAGDSPMHSVRAVGNLPAVQDQDNGGDELGGYDDWGPGFDADPLPAEQPVNQNIAPAQVAALQPAVEVGVNPVNEPAVPVDVPVPNDAQAVAAAQPVVNQNVIPAPAQAQPMRVGFDRPMGLGVDIGTVWRVARAHQAQPAAAAPAPDTNREAGLLRRVLSHFTGFLSGNRQ